MASNSFGNIFKITTWGESHGKAIGVIIDGCPAGLDIDETEINSALGRRAPGRTPYTSPRAEKDCAEILSGVFEGKTTGAPICIIIPNKESDSSKYEPIKDLLRPGHANYSYLGKYGIFDYRGGGRASARETACRVAAGAIARKILHICGIQLTAYIKQIGTIEAMIIPDDLESIQTLTDQSSIFCPDLDVASAMMALIEKAKADGDSLGGIVEFIASSVPLGIGDPVYEKLEANLAHAMMTLPASKGFEIGSGFRSSVLQGSEHNDIFKNEGGTIHTSTNHSGGVLGGICTGMPVVGRVAFKPPSSIMKPQETLTTSGEEAMFQLPAGSKHDPCVAIRAVPVVEAMAALVLVDAILLNRCAKL
jgi:chorismate synthase